MTPPGNSSRPWPLRIRRAEQLARQHPFASEILNFYRHVAGFQEYLCGKIDASGDTGIAPSGPLLGELDVLVVLPHFREFLAVVEQHAPAPLKESARQIARLAPESWIAGLQAYWNHGRGEQESVEPLKQFFPRAFLQPYAEYRAGLVPSAPLFTTTNVCPLCQSRPLLGVLRPEGDGGKRFLMCSFCSHEWEFRRLLCAHCREEQEQKLPLYQAEEFPHIRLECCETCKHVLRTIDLTKDGHAVPLVDDLAAIPLGLWAEEHGYQRIQANLLWT